MRSAGVGGFGAAIAGALDAGAGAGIVAATSESGPISRDVVVSLLEQPDVNETAHRKSAIHIHLGFVL
jgi:hypothetical protein